LVDDDLWEVTSAKDGDGSGARVAKDGDDDHEARVEARKTSTRAG
jgi:hypothetical protein